MPKVQLKLIPWYEADYGCPSDALPLLNLPQSYSNSQVILFRWIDEWKKDSMSKFLILVNEKYQELNMEL
jgi:hypothetical protein